MDARSLEESERTETAREVYIGENVYVSNGYIIKGGTCISNNAIVHAMSPILQAGKPRPYRSFDLRPLCNLTVQWEDPDRACAGYSSKLPGF